MGVTPCEFDSRPGHESTDPRLEESGRILETVPAHRIPFLRGAGSINAAGRPASGAPMPSPRSPTLTGLLRRAFPALRFFTTASHPLLTRLAVVFHVLGLIRRALFQALRVLPPQHTEQRDLGEKER